MGVRECSRIELGYGSDLTISFVQLGRPDPEAFPDFNPERRENTQDTFSFCGRSAHGGLPHVVYFSGGPSRAPEGLPGPQKVFHRALQGRN